MGENSQNKNIEFKETVCKLYAAAMERYASRTIGCKSMIF